MGYRVNIRFRTRFSIEQIFFVAQVTVALGLCFVAILLLGRGTTAGFDARISKGVVKDFGRMLTGPLALRENEKSPLAISLEQKLMFVAQSVRPDMEGERVLKIGVMDSDVERVVKEGEAVRCNLDVHDGGAVRSVEFSDEGDTEMAVQVADGKSLFLRMKQGTGESMDLVLQARGAGASGKVPGGLSGAKMWGEDLFFQKYGGARYRPMGKKVQVEIEGKYVVYLEEGDFLTFREGKWDVVELESARKTDPLAKVVHIGNGLELEAWDGKGFSLFQAKFERERAQALRFDPQQVIQEAKMRTSRQVSCKIGKQRMTLQASDWLLKRKESWHKLRSKDEIDAFLNHELRGELLVIDSIDKSGLVRGNYFNEMRTKVQPLSFRAASSNNKKGRK